MGWGMGDGRLVVIGGWGVECTYLLTHSLTIWPDWPDWPDSRERSVLFGLNKLVLEMEMEKEIYVYSQGVALCTLPTYLPTLPCA